MAIVSDRYHVCLVLFRAWPGGGRPTISGKTQALLYSMSRNPTSYIISADMEIVVDVYFKVVARHAGAERLLLIHDIQVSKTFK